MKAEYEIRTVLPGERETDVLIFGRGAKALLLLPGLSVNSVLCSAAAIARAYGAFTATHTVYLPDRRKRIPAGYTVPDMAADTAAAARALGIETADVAGMSQGGMIAMCLALQQPALVDRLVICSSAARVAPAAAATLRGWMDLARAGDTAALTADFTRRLFSPAFCAMLAHAPAPEPLTQAQTDRFLALAGAAEHFDILNELKNIRCPTLALGAQEDAVLTGEAVLETAEALGGERYLYPPPYGHGVYDEAKDFRERILRFLQAGI